MLFIGLWINLIRVYDFGHYMPQLHLSDAPNPPGGPMPHRHRHLSRRAYESLREQIATAVALCSDEQVLDLADALHDTLRRRRSAEGRTFAPAATDAGDDFRLVS
jgi:hypothetical protein